MPHDYESHSALDILIKTTNRCNLKCDYCIEKCNMPRNIVDIDFDMLKEFLTIIKKKYTLPIRITLSGGEFLLHPLAKDIINYIKNHITSKIEIITNLNYSPKFIRWFINAGCLLTVSIHFNYIKNKTRLINNLREFNSNIIDISYMLEETNISENIKFYELINELYPDKLSLHNIFGKDIAEYNQLTVSTNNYKVLTTDGFLTLNDAQIRKHNLHHNYLYKCSAPQRNLVFNYDGIITFCEGSGRFSIDAFRAANIPEFIVCRSKTCNCFYNIYRERLCAPKE